VNFLTRLRRDARGNTLAIVAAALVPLIAMIGSGVDMSRAYMVESRLQQACDAGVLAGRKEMADGRWSTAARTAAEEYFNVNFASDYLGSQSVSFTPTNPTGTTSVRGVASANLPTVIMTFFSIADMDISVSCEAKFDIANSDITFVLDTTGSMACPSDANDDACSGYWSKYGGQEGKSYGSYSRTSRMSALKSAMDGFYTTLKSAASTSGARIRYSFVPYTGTVNVGRLLPANYIADSAAYQSRKYELVRSQPAETVVHFQSRSSAYTWNCGLYSGVWHGTRIYGRYDNGYGGCIWDDYHPAENIYETVYKRVVHPTNVYKTFSWTSDPTGSGLSSSIWGGCIMERDTVASGSISYSTGTRSFSPNGLYDLDIDSAPTSEATKWRPYWPEVSFYRNLNTTETSSGSSPQTSCPYEARLLAEYSTLKTFQDYNKNLVPDGGTYHDIGLLWGARLSSENGIFASNVAAPALNSGYVSRHIIFMTDGQLDPGDTYYNAYGIERHDGRITGMSTSTNQNSIIAEQRTRHTNRYKQLCKAIKAKGIRLWVVAFNTTLTSEMTDCASPNSSFTADNAASLNEAFQDIAEQVADLRLTD